MKIMNTLYIILNIGRVPLALEKKNIILILDIYTTFIIYLINIS